MGFFFSAAREKWDNLDDGFNIFANEEGGLDFFDFALWVLVLVPVTAIVFGVGDATFSFGFLGSTIQLADTMVSQSVPVLGSVSVTYAVAASVSLMLVLWGSNVVRDAIDDDYNGETGVKTTFSKLEFMTLGVSSLTYVLTSVPQTGDIIMSSEVLSFIGFGFGLFGGLILAYY